MMTASQDATTADLGSDSLMMALYLCQRIREMRCVMRGIFLYVVSIWSANMAWRPMAMVRVDPGGSWKMNVAEGLYTQTGTDRNITFFVDVPAGFPLYAVDVGIFPPTTRIVSCSTDSGGRLLSAGVSAFSASAAFRVLRCTPSQSVGVGIRVPVVRPMLAGLGLGSAPVKLEPSMVVFGGSLVGLLVLGGVSIGVVQYFLNRAMRVGHFSA